MRAAFVNTVCLIFGEKEAKEVTAAPGGALLRFTKHRALVRYMLLWIIHRSDLTVRQLLSKTRRSAACCIGFFRPSNNLSPLQMKSISEIEPMRNSSRAAAMSSISRFSDVFHPFDMTSNKILLSVSNVRGRLG